MAVWSVVYGNVLYQPLKEEEIDESKGWNKETIEFVINNKSKIENKIRGYKTKEGKSVNINAEDIEDIYSSLLLYLYGVDDFNDFYQYDNKSCKVQDLSSYVYYCTKICVQRYITEKIEKERNLIRTVEKKGEDGEELSILEFVGDKESENILENIDYSFEYLCKTYECYRNKFGVDFYLLLYIKLVVDSLDGTSDLYFNVLKLLEISKNDINNFKETKGREILEHLICCTKIIGTKEAIEVLEKYVFGAVGIRKAIEKML